MKIVQMDKKTWAEGLAQLKTKYRIYGPVRDQGFHTYQPLDKDEQPDFSCLNTRLSPKAIVYPQSQTMFTYSLDEKQPDHHIMKPVETGDMSRAVVGIRPCDAKAFQLVKMNFDTPEYKDPYWLDAYAATTFVGLACNSPCSTCFCTSSGCGPFHEEGLDVLLIDKGDTYAAKLLTEKGAHLFDAAGWNALPEAVNITDQLEDMKKASEAKIRSFVKTDRLKEIETTELYEAPFWEDVAFSCINCGTCTYVCPTCWCFDIQDENRGLSGKRMRNWDSCMYPLFTLHGSGHNPRGTKTHRVRQRFMHKLKYFVDKYDSGIQCVGCGRCVRLCPVNIDIRKVCSLMNSYDAAACACPAP
jgi:formate hydrogenlyase subunit 6/NADH:ubiquinone oxidoreductase subunit I